MSTNKGKTEIVDTCREYARSLINNISLLSGYVLSPNALDISNICAELETLQAAGFDLRSEANTKLLIHGTAEELEYMPAYIRLKSILGGLRKITMEEDNSQYGGMRGTEVRYPVLSYHAGLYNPGSGRIY